MRQNLLLLCFALSACAVGPDYHRPQPAVASSFGELKEAESNSRLVAGGDVTQHWWEVFHDAELASLIRRAVEGNRDLQQAVSRVRQARAQRGVVAAGLFPEIAAAANYNRSRGSKNAEIPLGALQAGGTSAGGQPSLSGLPGTTTDLYQAGFDASWELDVFGGTRRAIEAANAGIAAAEDARRAVLVSLLAEVASTYVELRADQRRLEIAQENLAAQRDVLDVTQAKLKAGFATDLEVAQQAAQVATTAATIPTLEMAERDAGHELAFLLGRQPTDLEAELAPPAVLPPVPPEIPVGLPSDLLRRRPDIQRAEHELQAATAQVGVAVADFFPKFSLTGAAGLASGEVKHLGDWSSRYHAIGPSLSWPILDWGRIRNQVRVQNELQQQALIGYENTVAQALKEVEDALVHFQKEQARRAALADAVASGQKALDLARQKYQHGLVDLVTTLDAQRSLLSAEDAFAQSDSVIRTDLIALYKALGGGWEF